MHWNPLAQLWNRRHFLTQCGLGAAHIALAGQPHFAPKAKRLIYLFMEGGPSQLDLFDDKPRLRERDGEAFPMELLAGKKFAFMENMAAPTVQGSRATFKQHGQSGNVVSSYLPHIASIADRIAILHHGRILVEGTLGELKDLLPAATVEYVEKQPTLEDVFLALVGADGETAR